MYTSLEVVVIRITKEPAPMLIHGNAIFALWCKIFQIILQSFLTAPSPLLINVACGERGISDKIKHLPVSNEKFCPYNREIFINNCPYYIACSFEMM